MKKIILIALTICCIIACSEKEDVVPFEEDETPVDPTITLYDKTPEFIWEYIQGRWEITTSYGGFSGITDLENTFMTFNDSTYEREYYNGRKVTVHFVWKKEPLRHFPVYGDSTYIYGIWEIDREYSGIYFSRIINDTLSIGHYTNPNMSESISGKRLVRVK